MSGPGNFPLISQSSSGASTLRETLQTHQIYLFIKVLVRLFFIFLSFIKLVRAEIIYIIIKPQAINNPYKNKYILIS